MTQRYLICSHMLEVIFLIWVFGASPRWIKRVLMRQFLREAGCNSEKQRDGLSTGLCCPYPIILVHPVLASAQFQTASLCPQQVCEEAPQLLSLWMPGLSPVLKVAQLAPKCSKAEPKCCDNMERYLVCWKQKAFSC